ncbi:hypothetical protein [Bdellovibrio sp. HCB337]|uniref:hypothetical protein n=1 Tax=Bdellovibrio sp. HCB337 TaxID=3394358 RepID=UPI0039A4A4F5
MSYSKIILYTLLLLGSSAFAKDVTPEEKLGQLEIKSIDISKLSTIFDLKNFSMKFYVDDKSKSVDFDLANTVAAGTGCLEVIYRDSSGPVYEARQCNILVEEKKTTHLQLAAIKYTWNADQYKTEFGPQPLFTFSAADASNVLRLYRGISSSDPYGQPVLLIPAMPVLANLYHEHTGTLFSKTTVIKSGTLQTETLDTKELRGIITLDFIDGKPKFPETESTRNYLHATYWKREPYDERESHAPLNNSSAYNYYEFKTDGTSQSIRAFPLLKGVKDATLEVSINEHLIKPTLSAGQTIRIPVATLNVNDYRSNLPGTFKVYSSKNQRSGVLAEHLHPYIHNFYSQPSLRETYFPTKTSLFFPIGHLLRLDFYAIDDLGRNTLQDQIKVDLTKENSPSLY